MNAVSTITNEEDVVRILHKDWVVNGNIQLGAFTLRPNEVYISVNRPIVESFVSDVSDFVENHPMYQHTETTYRCALMGVKEVRGISLTNNGEPINIDVEVEPRATRMQSHAGIFTRIGSSNIKVGSPLPAEALPLGLSSDDILMEVGWSLIAISKLEEKTYKESSGPTS